MSPSLRETLQTSLGASYTLERELGGGGLPRGFGARDGFVAREQLLGSTPVPESLQRA